MEKMAKVVDNNDPEKLGKIKVRILPEMEDFSENILPWVGVYNQNDTTHSVPDNETFIRVVVEDWPYMQRIRYISDDFVEGEDSYSQFNANIEELSSQKYPQPSFKRYKDGTIVFHNSDTGEHGTYFSNGGYFLSDKDGNVHINSKSGKLSIKNDVISLREFFEIGRAHV